MQKHLYTQTTIQGVLDQYIKELDSGNMESILHANKWRAYKNSMQDKQFVKDLRKLFNEIYDLVEKKHPNLQFSIIGRRKSLISAERKMLRYASMGRSLDLIRDFYAFRIVLFSPSEIDLIKHCYMLLEQIIEYSVNKGFTPCERLPLIGVQNINEHKTPYFSSFKYKGFVKDYICFPKENGYESIHLVLVDTKGRYVEIQIRTLAMHAKIESTLLCNHDEYKEKKYKDISFPFDRNKISVEGYSYTNNYVFDFVGVEKPKIIFRR